VRFLERDRGRTDPTDRVHRFAPPRWRLRETAKPATKTSV
jgi:hypothetical protein